MFSLFFGRNVFKHQSTCATILIYLLRSTHEIYVNASVLWLLYIGSIRWMSLNQRYIVDDNFIHNTFTIHHTDAHTHIGDVFHRSINCKDKILSTSTTSELYIYLHTIICIYMQKMKSVLLVFLAYLLFRQCIINHWCAYKQLWKSTTTKSSDWVYLNQKWFNICSINWVIFWRIENWVLLWDPNMNRLTLILFIQNPYFFLHGEKWCEYEYPSESDLIGFTLQCSRDIVLKLWMTMASRFFLFNYYFSSVAFYLFQKKFYNLAQRDPV